MKTAISIPDDVFVQAERLSRRKRLSRSELYTTAIRWYVAHESGQGITERLNQVYGKNQAYDRALESAGLADLPRDEW